MRPFLEYFWLMLLFGFGTIIDMSARTMRKNFKYFFGGDWTKTIETVPVVPPFIQFPQINDAKHAALLTLLVSPTGQIDDLEYDVLKNVFIVGATTGKEHVNDLWHLFWDEQAVAAGQFNDRDYAYMGTQGHVQGQINSRRLSYWNSFI